MKNKDCFNCRKEISKEEVVYIIVKTTGVGLGKRWISQPGKNMLEEIKNMEDNTIVFHEKCFDIIAGKEYKL